MDTKSQVVILDPSNKFRPEKNEARFRDYTADCAYHSRVRNTYYQMHTNQTLDFARQKLAQWTKFDRTEMTVMEALQLLNSLVDESDPDLDVPNSVHAFQTAERIREAHPDKDWFHLTGLVHDLGKVLAIFGEPQWCVVGDTFPVGCEFADECVFGKESFKDNPDLNNPLVNTRFGIYKENCGFEHVTMSWGHDEYMFHVLKNHAACTLPEEALYMIRYHSFYPWHTAGAYTHLCSNKDRDMLAWVLEFNKYDLYSKADSEPDVEVLTAYYQSLVDKYIPGKLKW